MDKQQLEILQALLLKQNTPLQFGNLVPFEATSKKGDDPAWPLLGTELFQQGRVAAVMVAGGQGTRFGHDGPKGTARVSVIKRKSLFQLFLEKLTAASKFYACELQLAIMTSAGNHHQIAHYLEQNNYFGALPQQVHLFQQGSYPLLDSCGQPILTPSGEPLVGPNGNGGCFHHLRQTPIWELWKQRGIEWVHFFFVDNPLADPFDAELAGFCTHHRSDIAIKATHRRNGSESVGALILEDGKLRVIEYTDLPLETAGCALLANIGLYCFRLDFIQKITDKIPLDKLPLHLAQKQTLWKFEHFIFDLLPYAQKTDVLVYPREDCFAPLKNSHGENSIESVARALQQQDKKIFKRFFETPPPLSPFELAQDFHYPTPSFCNAWRNKEIPKEGYVE